MLAAGHTEASGAQPAAEGAPSAESVDMDRGPGGRCVPLVGTSGGVLGAALRPGVVKNPIYISIGEHLGVFVSTQFRKSMGPCQRHTACMSAHCGYRLRQNLKMLRLSLLTQLR